MRAIERSHIYLYGGHFTLLTDCNLVELILNNPRPQPPARIDRWNLRLQDYDFNVRYTKGQNNPSDFPSRHLLVTNTTDDSHFQTVADNYVCFLTHHAVPRAMTLPEIREVTLADPTLQFLGDLISTGKWHQINSLNMQSNPKAKVPDVKSYQKIKTVLTLND